jgi:hypothetical protein
MHSKSGAFTTIQVSDDITCQIIPLVGKYASEFTSVDDHFFTEGEALSAQVDGVATGEDPAEANRAPRWLARRRSLVGVMGAVVIVGTVLLIRSGGHAADRAVVTSTPAPPTVMPAIAAATPAAPKSEKPAVVPDEPVKIPAPAPADDHGDGNRQRPPSPEAFPSHPGLASAGAAAGPGAGTMDECKKAFDRHRSKDVLAKCAEAFTGDPSSADAAVMLAKTELDRGRTQQALDWAQKAIAIDADRADAYAFLGSAEQVAGHAAAAKAAYKRYLQLAPQGRYAADLRAVLAAR